MNIYLHVETTIRELDSKLLLATLAASRGHEVIISDIEGIEKGIIIEKEFVILTMKIYQLKNAYKN